MKRLLPLALLSLLLLAPAARGGEPEDIESAIRNVDVQVESIREELKATEHPQKRAELQAQIEIARTHRKGLESALANVRTRLAAAADEHAGLRQRAEATQTKATTLHRQALGRRKVLLDKGDMKRAEAMDPTVQQAEHDLGAALTVSDVLARAEVHLRQGELSDAQLGLMEARDRLEQLEVLLREREQMKLAAAAAEAAAEHARRAATSDEIMDRLTAAEAGIAKAEETRARLLDAVKKARDPEDVEAIKRIHERMARFEAHAANFYSAQALLKTARSHLEAQKIDEARKALGQAWTFLEKGAQQPLDDGNASRPAPEFRTQRAQIEALREIAARGAAARTHLEKALDARLKAAQAAGEPVDVASLKQRSAQLEDDNVRLRAARAALEQARTHHDGERYEEARQAYEAAKARLDALEVLRAGLGDVAEKSDRPFHGDPGPKEANEAALRTQIAELEVQLARLSEKVTDKHEAHIALSQRIRVLKERLAGLENRRAYVRLVTDADGHFVISGLEDGKYRVRLVTGDHAVVSGRVVGPDGEVVTGPTTVEKTIRRVVTRNWTPADAEARKRIDHLRQAAKHLREAGQTDQARRLEQDAKKLEDSLRRYTMIHTGGAGSAQVMRAIGDLRQEVRALRKEVKELKALILENR